MKATKPHGSSATSGSSATPAEPEPWQKVGGTARIAGLQRRSDLNGSEVVLLRWDEVGKRWQVRIETGKLIGQNRSSVRVLPSNLQSVMLKSA